MEYSEICWNCVGYCGISLIGRIDIFMPYCPARSSRYRRNDQAVGFMWVFVVYRVVLGDTVGHYGPLLNVTGCCDIIDREH